MKRLAFIALLALGCDDSGVQAKVADVLLHGMVEAQAKCDFQGTSPQSSSSTQDMHYAVHKFVDGSTFSSIRSGGSTAVAFCERNEVCAESGLVVLSTPTTSYKAEASDGSLEFEWSHTGYTSTFVSEDLSTYCTGFNLGAF